MLKPHGTYPPDEWPIDVQRTDASGEVDVSLIEYNLSLSPAQRLAQCEAFVNFVREAKQVGRRAEWSSSANY